MKIAKRILSIALAIITLVSVVSISAEALTVKVEKKKYGYMVPVNNKGTKVISSVKLYGSYDYLNFYIHSGVSGDVYFFYEIFSDKKLTKCIDSGCILSSYGDYNVSQKIKLEGKYKSRTYYVVTYAGKYSSSKDKLTVDENSMCLFEMIVDRSPSYNEKEVMLKSVSNTVNGPEIKWSKISGTSKYYIYRRSITGKTYKKVGSVSGKKSSFVDTSVKKKDGNYIYTVKGIDKKGVASQYHYNGITCLYAESPTIYSVKLIEDNVIRLEWKKTDSDAIYHIYRKEIGGSWKKLDTDCPNNYYSDITAENGKEYMYRVKSVIETDYGKATSVYYVADKMTVNFLEAPIMNKLEITENGIGLSWNSVEGAWGYSVLRKPLGSDCDWEILNYRASNETSYVDKTASLTNGAYVYSVRSEGDGFSGSYSPGKEYFTLKEPEFTVSVDADGVHIKWDKVQYATSYRVLEQLSNGTWSIKTKTKKSSYDFKPSGFYDKKITVCAVRGEVKEYKEDVENIRYFPTITPEIKEFDTYTEFIWNPTKADKYRVYRKLKNAPDTDYELFYESNKCGFSNGSPVNDVAYTYQVRGVYGEIEQYNNFVSKTLTRYSPETCIKEFNAYREVEVLTRWNNGYDYEIEYYGFNVVKTDKFKKSNATVYYWCCHNAGEEHWTPAGNSYRVDTEEYIVNPVKPVRFCCVVTNSKGSSTPFGANTIYIPEETCEIPDVTLSPTSKGFKITWKAVDNAVKYDIFVDFAKLDNFEKTIEADGSKTYTVNVNDIEYYTGMNVQVTAIHENGNKSTKTIDEYSVSPKPKLVKAGLHNGKIAFLWNGEQYDNYQYAVMRKAEGDSKWTVVSRKTYRSKSCIMVDGKEYTAFAYTDDNTKKGVKYTYTVRLYNPKTKEYASYYDTKGVSAKR